MRDQIIEWLSQNVSKDRLQHIFGVEEMCIELAEIHNCDRSLAGMAGLTHDLAKFFPPEKLLTIAKKNNLPLDEITAKYPHLIHADVGAIVAQEEFGIDNPSILNAISNHTLGNPKMDKLSCIVFIADKSEKNRGDTPELTEIREISSKNLYLGLVKTCNYSLSHLIATSRSIHPRSILTRNWALSQYSSVNKNTIVEEKKSKVKS